MKQNIQATTFLHSQKIVFVVMILFLLGVGAVGEVAATAPDCAANELGGQLFKGCEDHRPIIKR